MHTIRRHRATRRWRRHLLAIAFAPSMGFSQTGTIAGTIVDRATHQPIEAVQVTVTGTSYGTLTKTNGTYMILGVPPGTYTVSMKRAGYSSSEVTNVTVRVDVVRSLDAELSVSSTAGMQLVPTSQSCLAGTAFGITAYTCANCGMSAFRDSVHVVYNFGTEPIITEVPPNSKVRTGDVVVAVNGNPITSRSGADQFAYPPRGPATLTVRRNGVNVDIDQTVGITPCPPGGAFSTLVSAGRGGIARTPPDSAAAGGRMGPGGQRMGRGVSAGRAEVVPQFEATSATVEIENFGLVLTCRPSCTRSRARDGTTYWRFDGYPAAGYPSLTTPMPKDGLAAKAGIHAGDVLISINGLSPITEEGAMLINRAERELTLTLEFSRAGKRQTYTLKL